MLGMGAGVTHNGARDDFSFSMKATAICDANGWRRLLKEPITDRNKKSLSGLVRCEENEAGELIVFDCLDNPEDLFRETAGWRLWFKDGERTNFQSFDEVQERARALPI